MMMMMMVMKRLTEDCSCEESRGVRKQRKWWG